VEPEIILFLKKSQKKESLKESGSSVKTERKRKRQQMVFGSSKRFNNTVTKKIRIGRNAI
jgi:hypothetical protein